MKDYSKFREEFAEICYEQDHELLKIIMNFSEHAISLCPYDSLSEEEKEKSRKQADSFLDILEVDAINEKWNAR